MQFAGLLDFKSCHVRLGEAEIVIIISYNQHLMPIKGLSEHGFRIHKSKSGDFVKAQGSWKIENAVDFITLNHSIIECINAGEKICIEAFTYIDFPTELTRYYVLNNEDDLFVYNLHSKINVYSIVSWNDNIIKAQSAPLCWDDTLTINVSTGEAIKVSTKKSEECKIGELTLPITRESPVVMRLIDGDRNVLDVYSRPAEHAKRFIYFENKSKLH